MPALQLPAFDKLHARSQVAGGWASVAAKITAGDATMPTNKNATDSNLVIKNILPRYEHWHGIRQRLCELCEAVQGQCICSGLLRSTLQRRYCAVRILQKHAYLFTSTFENTILYFKIFLGAVIECHGDGTRLEGTHQRLVVRKDSELAVVARDGDRYCGAIIERLANAGAGVRRLGRDDGRRRGTRGSGGDFVRRHFPRARKS